LAEQFPFEYSYGGRGEYSLLSTNVAKDVFVGLVAYPERDPNSILEEGAQSQPKCTRSPEDDTPHPHVDPNSPGYHPWKKAEIIQIPTRDIKIP